jgi:hypothetical protein
MSEIIKGWILRLQQALTFNRASEQMKLTRVVEKFDVVERVPVASPIKYS